MKKWFKRGIFTLVTLFIVTLVGAAVFLLTFDPNAYKERVEQIVYERYQRQLDIKGEIELSLFPRIGLSVADVSLSDHESDATFASVDSARFAVAVWPLLWNKLVVDHVAVSGFKVWLARDDQGEFNFTDLLQRADPVPSSLLTSALTPIARVKAESSAPLAPDTDQTVFQIDIAGLDLKEGEIHFFDTNSQTQMRLINLELNTGRMTFGQPFDVIFKGRLQGDKPLTDATLEGQTVLQLEPQLKRYIAQRIKVALVGKVGPYQANSATLKGKLELLTLTEDLRAHNIEIITQGQWQDERFTLNKTNVNLTLSELNLKQNLEYIKTAKLKVRAQGVLPVESTQAEHKVELALDIPQLNIEPEQVSSEPIALSFKQSQGASLFGINAHIKGLSGSLAQLKVAQIQGDIVGKNTNTAWKLEANSQAQAQWQDQSFSLQWHDMDASLRLDDDALNPNPAHAKITGQGQWHHTDKKMQFDGLWQSANTHAQIHSSLIHDENWQAKIEVDAKEIDVNPWIKSVELRQQRQEKRGQKPAPAADFPMLPSYINWAALEAQLTLQAQELKVQSYRFTDLQLMAQQSAGVLNIKQAKAGIFDGSLDATGSWHSAQAQAALKAQLKGIDFGLLSQAIASKVALEGQGNLNLDVQTQGLTQGAWRAGLDGTLGIQTNDGRLVGWSFWQQLNAVNEVVRNVFSGQAEALPQQLDTAQSTPFRQLEATVQMKQGQAQLEQFALQAEGVNIQAEPNSYIDLVNGQLHLALQANLQEKELTERQKSLSTYAAYPLYMDITGPWATPNYRWQWQRLEHPTIKEAIDNGLIEMLARPDLNTIIQASEPVADPSKTIGSTLKDLLNN